MKSFALLLLATLWGASCSQYQRYGTPQSTSAPSQAAPSPQVSYQVWQGETLLGKNQLRSQGMVAFSSGMSESAAQELGLVLAMAADQMDSSGFQATWTLSDLEGELGQWSTSASEAQEWVFSCPARSGQALAIFFSFEPNWQP